MRLRYASVRGTEMVGAFVNVIYYHLDRALDPVQRGKSNKLALYLIFSMKYEFAVTCLLRAEEAPNVV